MKKLLDIDIAVVDFVDPEAAAILSDAVKTVKAILKRREELDRMGQKDQTLYVMKGEVHDRPAHMLHHMLVLKGLNEAEGKVLAGMELPVDSVDGYYLDSYLRRIAKAKPAEIPALKQIYRKNAYYRSVVDLSSSLDSRYLHADYAQKTLSYNMLKMALDGKGRFIALNTDASRDARNINIQDPKNRDLMMKLFNKVEPNISTTSAKGMLIRNQHMAQRLYSVAQKHKSRIAVQLCGMAHVNGTHYEFHHKDALCHIFKNSVQPVMGVFIDGAFSERYDDLAKDELLRCKSVPDIRTDYNLPSKQKDTSFWGGLKELFNFNAKALNEQDERLYVNEKLEAMGLGAMRLPKVV